MAPPGNHRPSQMVLWLALVAALLAVVHVLVVVVYYKDVGGLRGEGLEFWHVAIFDLDEEESFGTWFSTLLLFVAGILTLAHARERRAASDGRHPWWRVLGVGFCFLSMDEVVGLHEYMNSLMADTVWTEVGALIALVVALAYLPFLWSLRWRTGLLFAVAGALYLGGALGVEHATEWYAEQDLLDALPYNLWTALEETLEMAGPILYVYALQDHARHRAQAA